MKRDTVEWRHIIDCGVGSRLLYRSCLDVSLLVKLVWVIGNSSFEVISSNVDPFETSMSTHWVVDFAYISF